MRIVKVFVVLLSLNCTGFAASPAPTAINEAAQFLGPHWQPHPFWEKPRKAILVEQGEILVSAHNENRRTWMKGVGLVPAELEKTYRFAQSYSYLEKIPKHFSDVHYDQKTGLLGMKVQLPFRSDERVEIRLKSTGDQSLRGLQFEMLKGFAVGTKGVILFEDLKRQPAVTRVSLQAVTLEKQEFSWMTNLGIEAVLKHVASSARRFLTEKEAP